MIVRTIVFYVLTFFFLMLLGGVQEVTGILPPQIGLAQWGPGLAAFAMLLIFRKDGHKLTWLPAKTPAKRYLTTAAIPAAMGLLVFLIQKVAGVPTTEAPEAYRQLGLVLLWTPLGALGEEIGWRGYLNKRLDTKWRGLVSALITGLLWMPIHVHFLDKGLVVVGFFLLWIISMSIVIYRLVHDQDFSILLATLFHLAINLINLLIIDVMYQPLFWVINGTAWAILAAVVVIRNKDLYLKKK